MVRPLSVAVTPRDREHLDTVVAADRHEARAGTVDHLRPGRLGQRQRAGQRDRLRRAKTIGSNWMMLPRGFGFASAWRTPYRKSPWLPDPAPVSLVRSTV